MDENIENLEFIEVSKLAKTEDPTDLYFISSLEQKENKKVVSFPAKNLVTKDDFDTKLKKTTDELDDTIKDFKVEVDKKTGGLDESIENINTQIEEINKELEKNIKFKGYYKTLYTLLQTYPKPDIGDYAWVETPFPGYLYIESMGSWWNTETKVTTPTVDLKDYVQTSDLADYAQTIENNETVIRTDISKIKNGDLLLYENNRFVATHILDLLKSYGFEVSPANIFIKNILKENAIIDSDLIVSSYNSLPNLVKSDANVVLIPGAYKEGVIYGLNTRTGEAVNFNFSRATTATYFDDDLNLHLATANTPRVDYLNYNNKPKILIEKAASNIAIQSEGVKPPDLGNYTVADITMCNFTKNAIVYPIIPSGGAIQYCYRKVSNASGSFSYSFLVKAAVADMLKIGTGSTDKEVDFIVAGSYTKSTKINIDKIGSDLYRVQIVHNVGATNVDFNFGLNRYVGNRNTTDLNLTAFQLEVGETATSYIPTTTTQVARSADNLSYTLKSACSVYLKTTKQNVVLDKAAGLWNIHNDLNNEGILELAIFDRVLTADEKAQLTA